MTTHRLNDTGWMLRLLSCIRFDEIFALQGAPLLGAAFAISVVNSQDLIALTLLTAGNCLLVAHVFLLNDWAGIDHDLRDPARSTSVFLARGIRRQEIAWLLTGALLVALTLLGMIGTVTLMVGGLIAVASALYSAPPVHLKGVPVMSSLLHLLSGMLHFLLGYSVFRSIDARGLAIALFFAVIFSAGHLTQEVRDADADLRNNIRTNAVRFGRLQTFFAAFALFTIADAWLCMLALRGVVPRALMIIAALYPIHACWTWQVVRQQLRYDRVKALQRRYRALYAVLGAVMVVTLFRNL